MTVPDNTQTEATDDENTRTWNEDRESKTVALGGILPVAEANSPKPLVEAIEDLIFHQGLTPMAKVLLMALAWKGEQMSAESLGKAVGCSGNQVHYAFRSLVRAGVVSQSLEPDLELQKFVRVYRFDTDANLSVVGPDAE